VSGYELLKFLHVSAVIGWVGAPVFLTILQARLRGAEDRATLMGIGRQMETLGKVYFSPLAAATLVTGVLMVATTDGLSFGDPWILIGLAGIAATMGIGLGVITPTGKKLAEASQATPPDGAAIASLSQRMTTLTIVNIVILLFVVWAVSELTPTRRLRPI
jgi:uncharacterized membrane protein